MKYVRFSPPLILLLLMMLAFAGCEKGYAPKPSGYPRIDRAEGGYRLYDDEGFPLIFEVDSASVVSADLSEKGREWVNIFYPKYDAKIYCSYIAINPSNKESIFNQSRDLVYLHASKADEINAVSYSDTLSGVDATLYILKGSAATPLQFTVSNGVDFLFRGALYFNTKVNSDSVAPVVDYIRGDIEHLIESLKRRSNGSSLH